MNLQYNENMNKNKHLTQGIPMKGKKMTIIERQKKIESDIPERKRLFKELRDHLAKGLSLDCFSALSKETIFSYCEKYPDEFNKEELQQSVRDGRDWWENIGRSQANGSCMGNSRTWYYNMSNRYGWRDKVDIESDNKHHVNVNVVSYASTKSSTDNKR